MISPHTVKDSTKVAAESAHLAALEAVHAKLGGVLPPRPANLAETPEAVAPNEAALAELNAFLRVMEREDVDGTNYADVPDARRDNPLEDALSEREWALVEEIAAQYAVSRVPKVDEELNWMAVCYEMDTTFERACRVVFDRRELDRPLARDPAAPQEILALAVAEIETRDCTIALLRERENADVAALQRAVSDVTELAEALGATLEKERKSSAEADEAWKDWARAADLTTSNLRLHLQEANAEIAALQAKLRDPPEARSGPAGSSPAGHESASVALTPAEVQNQRIRAAIGSAPPRAQPPSGSLDPPETTKVAASESGSPPVALNRPAPAPTITLVAPMPPVAPALPATPPDFAAAARDALLVSSLERFAGQIASLTQQVAAKPKGGGKKGGKGGSKPKGFDVPVPSTSHAFFAPPAAPVAPPGLPAPGASWFMPPQPQAAHPGFGRNGQPAPVPVEHASSWSQLVHGMSEHRVLELSSDMFDWLRHTNPGIDLRSVDARAWDLFQREAAPRMKLYIPTDKRSAKRKVPNNFKSSEVRALESGAVLM